MGKETKKKFREGVFIFLIIMAFIFLTYQIYYPSSITNQLFVYIIINMPENIIAVLMSVHIASFSFMPFILLVLLAEIFLEKSKEGKEIEEATKKIKNKYRLIRLEKRMKELKERERKWMKK